MRQVPTYLLIGNGRVSRHFQRYFSLLGLSFLTWSRKQPQSELLTAIEQATHILILIPDTAIEPFIVANLAAINKPRIHFSGSLVTTYAYGAHPLMTFSHDLYELDRYQQIPFILDHDAPELSELLPGLPNSSQRLHTSLKAKYHALCVLSGNFSCMLWQKFFKTLESEFNLSPEIAHPYLQQQMRNLIENPEAALTGPLIRGDTETIQKNLQALTSDPFQAVFKSFVDCFAVNK